MLLDQIIMSIQPYRKLKLDVCLDWLALYLKLGNKVLMSHGLITSDLPHSFLGEKFYHPMVAHTMAFKVHKLGQSRIAL